MIVVACEMDLHITNHPRNLKEKRMVIRSLKEKIKQKFGVAVAEVGSEALWQRCTLGMASVGKQKKQAEELMQSAIHFVECRPDIEIITAACQIY